MITEITGPDHLPNVSHNWGKFNEDLLVFIGIASFLGPDLCGRTLSGVDP
jgi:hypothetical protein